MTAVDLLHRARRGDTRAWQELYARVMPAVWRYACALTANRSEAEEVTSETLLALVRKLPELDPQQCHLDSWLRGVVRHKACDLARRAGRQRDLMRRAGRDPVREPPEGDPAQPSQIEETGQRVWEVLDRLEDHERQTLEWKYVDNLSVREIAERIGQTEKAAESVLYRARKEFRRLYDLAERRDGQPTQIQPRTTD